MTMTQREIVDRIINLARLDLADIYKERGVVEEAEFDEAVSAAHLHAQDRLKFEIGADLVALAQRDLETMFNVLVGNEHVLVDNSNHVPWLDRIGSDINWSYWERYRQWLIQEEHRPVAVVDDSIDAVSNSILGLIEDPRREGAWDRRGLVAGQVQSGKTSNYVALINKALDVGYKLIIVLAGTHDNLRSQTQLRINTGVLGFDTQENVSGTHGKRVGVGLIDGQKPKINCPTSSAQKGDFNRRLASGVGALGSDPIILVVKKNKAILENLYAWATGLHHDIDPGTSRKIVRNVPTLVIDDEADYASVDTASTINKTTGIESDPSTTNRLIRQLLDAFEKTAYIGYTATPFANIYINPSADHDIYGKDLFPEHFIVTLPETSAYSGAARVFGLVEDQAAGIDGVEALPTNRELVDYSTWLPDGHKKGDLPKSDLPASLVEAVHSFLLAAALKGYRRVSMRHNSMLIHVTRFVDVQQAVGDQVSALVVKIRNELSYLAPEDEDSASWMLLKKLYEEDFLPVNATLHHRQDLDGQLGEMPSFDDLISGIRDEAEKVAVSCINGESKEALQYENHPAGVTVIAIGGDKLSRGLTLEGLTTSYYLRASRMYDTLMQMGRWFGYRPRYLDVCRLYTTEQLIRWYSRITVASERLYREFEVMAALGKTPRDFGLRIQSHPDGLMVTAANKSRFSKNVRASFSGTVSETILFVDSKTARENNATNLRNLYARIKSSPSTVRPVEGVNYWQGVDVDAVLEWIDRYDAHEAALRALPKSMAEYIRACLALPSTQLRSWNVLIASKPIEHGEVFEIAPGTEIGLILRNPDGQADLGQEQPRSIAIHGRFVIGRLVSSGDEIRPLQSDPARRERALRQTIENWGLSTRENRRIDPPSVPSAVAERLTRDPSEGYLMVYPLQRHAAGLGKREEPYVGFAVAFPWSPEAPAVDYLVNEIYWDLEMMKALEEADENDE
jgi:hypothetical protein